MERIKWVGELACCSKCPGVWPLIMVKQPIEHYALHRKAKCEHCDDGEVDDHERCQHCDGAGGTVVAERIVNATDGAEPMLICTHCETDHELPEVED